MDSKTGATSEQGVEPPPAKRRCAAACDREKSPNKLSTSEDCLTFVKEAVKAYQKEFGGTEGKSRASQMSGL